MPSITDESVVVQERTTKDPITIAGEEAGICWDSDVSDPEKNYRRGLNCYQEGHGRTMEFAQVYLTLNNYSARVIRELYTHIGGEPTRLQESTRYMDYDNFLYVLPKSIDQNPYAKTLYNNCMQNITKTKKELEEIGVPKEDAAMVLPLGMSTRIVWRTNLRNLVDMSHQRLCTRANWEFRDLMHDIMDALAQYSKEWNDIINVYHMMVPKCEYLGYCPEKKSCGKYPNKSK